MPQYINTTDNRRYWPHVQNADGSTVELDPGEGVDLEEFNFEDGVEQVPDGLSRVGDETKVFVPFKAEEASSDAEAVFDDE